MTEHIRNVYSLLRSVNIAVIDIAKMWKLSILIYITAQLILKGGFV